MKKLVLFMFFSVICLSAQIAKADRTDCVCYNSEDYKHLKAVPYSELKNGCYYFMSVPVKPANNEEIICDAQQKNRIAVDVPAPDTKVYWFLD